MSIITDVEAKIEAYVADAGRVLAAAETAVEPEIKSALTEVSHLWTELAALLGDLKGL